MGSRSVTRTETLAGSVTVAAAEATSGSACRSATISEARTRKTLGDALQAAQVVAHGGLVGMAQALEAGHRLRDPEGGVGEQPVEHRGQRDHAGGAHEAGERWGAPRAARAWLPSAAR